MTDWTGLRNTAAQIQAGNDLMEPGNDSQIKDIIEKVKSGVLKEADLDICVKRILQYLVKTPAFRAYNYSNKPELLEAYKDRVLSLFGKVKARYPKITHISVFGEMFGGRYPHDDVKVSHKLSLIQKGVCYTPEHEFYGFDIYLFEDGNNRFLPVEEVNELFEVEGFFYARTLFRGTLIECLKYPNAFESKIAEWLGLPTIEAGLVLRYGLRALS